MGVHGSGTLRIGTSFQITLATARERQFSHLPEVKTVSQGIRRLYPLYRATKSALLYIHCLRTYSTYLPTVPKVVKRSAALSPSLPVPDGAEATTRYATHSRGTHYPLVLASSRTTANSGSGFSRLGMHVDTSSGAEFETPR